MTLTGPFHEIHMGVTAEDAASKYGVSRQEQDESSVESQRCAATDAARAAFGEEIVPVEVGGRKPFTVPEDEHPEPATTLEALAGLRPAFAEDGTVTTGNASGISEFLRSLRERGLTGVRLVIADHHSGLITVVRKVMLGAAHQRCRVHFLRNVFAVIPKDAAEMVAATIRTIFTQPTVEAVRARLDTVADMLGRQFPKVRTMFL